MPDRNPADKRRFIRHPADLPIEYEVESGNGGLHREETDNIGVGGLSFVCGEYLPSDLTVTVRIPLDGMLHSVRARVAWCSPRKDGRFVIGVEFNDVHERFKTRMVEQICRIEEYRKKVRAEEGRELTRSEAAEEWITRYSDKFPW